MQELKDLKAKLEAEKAEILKKSAPLHAARAKLVAKIQPLETELREIDKQIKAVERPRLVECGQQIAAIARAMGANGILNEGPAPKE